MRNTFRFRCFSGTTIDSEAWNPHYKFKSFYHRDAVSFCSGDLGIDEQVLELFAAGAVHETNPVSRTSAPHQESPSQYIRIAQRMGRTADNLFHGAFGPAVHYLDHDLE